jgi:ABC-type transporter Mla subunit MlaD
MALVRIAGIDVPGPSDVLAGARSVAGWAGEVVGVAAELPRRTVTLLDDVAGLVGRIGRIAERVEILLERVEGVADRADALVVRVGGTADEAERLVANVADTASEAGSLVASVTETADRATALVTRVAGTAGAAGELVARVGIVADEARKVVTEADAVAGRADGLVTQTNGMLETYAPIADKAAPLARRFVDEFSQDELAAAIRMVDQLPALVEHLENDIMPILTTLDRVGPDVHDLLDELKGVRQAINGIPGFGFFKRRGEEKDGDRDA